MLENSNINNLTLAPEFSINLPPSSLHSFRRILRNETESGALPEVLLADFKRTFTNKFYQSALDDYESIGFLYHNISVGTDGKCKCNIAYNIDYRGRRDTRSQGCDFNATVVGSIPTRVDFLIFSFLRPGNRAETRR